MNKENPEALFRVGMKNDKRIRGNGEQQWLEEIRETEGELTQYIDCF